MSQRQVNTSVGDDTHDAVERLQRVNGYEYKSDAARAALRRGLAELGYLGDGAGMTPARRLAREVAKLLWYVAATLGVLTVLGMVDFAAPALGVAAGATAVFATDRYLLRRVEPAVTNRLPRLEIKRRGNAR